MNFNLTQIFAAWLAAACAAMILALTGGAPDIPAAAAGDRDHVVLEAARIGDGSAEIVAGRLVNLLMDPAKKPALSDSATGGALPFEAIEGAGMSPRVSAILIERGIPVVYIRNDEGLVAIAEGGNWNDWVVERIEPDRVYFRRAGEQFDFLAFATVGPMAGPSGEAQVPADRPARRKRAGRREQPK